MVNSVGIQKPLKGDSLCRAGAVEGWFEGIGYLLISIEVILVFSSGGDRNVPKVDYGDSCPTV